MIENFRCASQNLRAAPGFTGYSDSVSQHRIGGTVSMFTLVNSILLKPLAYPEPDRLVASRKTALVRPPTIRRLESCRWNSCAGVKRSGIQSLALLRGATVNLTGVGAPEALGAARVSPSFSIRSRSSHYGPLFKKEEERRGTADVAIISAYLWRQRFSGDPLDYPEKDPAGCAPYEVVGVTPPDMAIFPRTPTASGSRAARNKRFLPMRFSVVEEQGRFNVSASGHRAPETWSYPGAGASGSSHSLPALRPNMTVAPDFRWWTVVEPLQTAVVARTGKPLWVLFFALLLCC